MTRKRKFAAQFDIAVCVANVRDRGQEGLGRFAADANCLIVCILVQSPWTGLLPAWLTDLVLGTHVHTFLGAEFLAAGLLTGDTRWAGQELRTTIRDVTGVSLPQELPYSQKADLVQFSNSIGLYEIKPGRITGLIDPSILAQDAKKATPQLNSYRTVLQANIPSHAVVFGTSFLPTVTPHPHFSSPLAPKNSVLVTFANYATHPGVLLYDFVPKKDGDEIKRVYDLEIGAVTVSVVMKLVVQRMFVQQQLTHATILAYEGKQADNQRMRMAASIAPIGIGLAGFGIGAIAFG